MTVLVTTNYICEGEGAKEYSILCMAWGCLPKMIGYNTSNYHVMHCQLLLVSRGDAELNNMMTVIHAV